MIHAPQFPSQVTLHAVFNKEPIVNVLFLLNHTRRHSESSSSLFIPRDVIKALCLELVLKKISS